MALICILLKIRGVHPAFALARQSYLCRRCGITQDMTHNSTGPGRDVSLSGGVRLLDCADLAPEM